MSHHRILIALDSVGIDPLGHNRPESVYSESRFLFPRGGQGEVLPLPAAPRPGILVETDVTGGAEQGAIECAIITFYKYQIPDLVSHTGRVELAREVFAIIERFVGEVLSRTDPAVTTVVITSDHGHLEQLSSSRGHPKSKVPTWYFGPQPGLRAPLLARPEGIFRVLDAASESAPSR